jgi:glycosyltransferase involved in cell wall biosynthesis
MAERIRTLWFTDWEPRAVREHLGLPADEGPQAWVDSLRDALAATSEVSLAVATPGSRRFAPFESQGTRYYDIAEPAPQAGVRGVVERWRPRLDDTGVLAAARDLVREWRPDIVHVHGTENPYGLLATTVRPTPTVVSLQGILQAYQRLYFAGRSPVDIARLAATVEFLKGRGAVHGYWWMRRTAEREARIMNDAQWFIGRTDWDRSVLAAANPRAAYFHCDEVIRPPFYQVDWAAVPHSGATVYSTSSVMIWKGAECLMEAAAILVRRGVSDLRLRIAGVRPGTELDTYYRRIARRWGVEARVDWLGRLDGAAMARELQGADAFAYPSHSDNSPNSVVEAMLVGVPIVAAGVGGVPSLVRDGAEGLLYPRGDPWLLADGILRLLNDRAAAAALGAAARARALVRNDPDRLAARTVEIYSQVIAEARGGLATATRVAGQGAG